MVTRDSILARKLPTKTVPMPEWSGDVVVRRLGADEYLSLVEKIKNDAERAVYWWVARATCDADAKRIFTDDDVPAIAKFEYVIVERLIEAILELNPQKDAAAKN